MEILRCRIYIYIYIYISEICKKQKNALAGSCDADGRKKNT